MARGGLYWYDGAHVRRFQSRLRVYNIYGTTVKMCWKLLALFLSLYPIVGESCSCYQFINSYDTLLGGYCNREVYSGVPVGATCTCLASEEERDGYRLDCRQYSYSEGDGVYSEEVLRRVNLETNRLGHSQSIKTCSQAEDTLSPGRDVDYILYCAYYVVSLICVL